MVTKFSKILPLAVLLFATVGSAQEPTRAKGKAVSYPWAFSKGTPTARTHAWGVVDKVASAGEYAPIPGDIAKRSWAGLGYRNPTLSRMPTAAQLSRFGKKVGADVVMYGSMSWHTRSIFVGTGPKTISTATINAYVFDVKKGRVVYSRKNVKGRSDEKEQAGKVAVAVLVTPLVTLVSGGPATPREQRAAEIALAKAYGPWVGN